MTDIISQLWYGYLEPIADFEKSNGELNELCSLLTRNADAIRNKAGDGVKDLFEKYNDCATEYTLSAEKEAFCEGFCLAVKIITQAIYR